MEICSSIKSVKYLKKYLFKGYDKALIEWKDLDEIKHHQETRYISSAVAAHNH